MGDDEEYCFFRRGIVIFHHGCVCSNLSNARQVSEQETVARHVLRHHMATLTHTTIYQLLDTKLKQLEGVPDDAYVDACVFACVVCS